MRGFTGVRFWTLFLCAVAALFTAVPSASGRGFQTGPPTYPVGVGPFFTIAADLRGSGLKDLVVANSNVNKGGFGNTISVLLNNGDGTYQSAVTYTVGTNPIGIAAGDFNRDGHMDLAVANAGSNTISILLGNGDGTFQPPTSITVGANPVGVFAADLKNRGVLDLVVTNSDLFGTDSCASSSVMVLLGNGNGTFGAPSTLHAGACPLDAAVVDLNKDGKLDLVVVNNGGMNSTTNSNVSVLLGNGNGTFGAATNYTVGSRPSFLTVADFNKDGNLDLAVSDQGGKNTGTGGGISLLRGNGNGTFQAAAFVPGITRANGIVSGDFNNDGNADIAITNNNAGGVLVLLGNGNGTFQSPKSFSLPSTNDGIAIADLNGDGKLDLAIPIDNSPSPGAVAVLIGKGDGTFAGGITSYSFGNSTSPQSVAVSDFNNDNLPDLAVGLTQFNGCNPNCSETGFVEVLTGAGNGTFNQGAPMSLPPNTSASGVTTGSFKNNGNQDIVVSQNSQSGTGFLSYFAGNGNGTFQSPANTMLNTNPFQTAAADFNKDGNLDVVIGDCGGLDYFLGNGNGTFGAANFLQSNGFCVGGQIAVGDLNGDGYPDLVVTNANSGILYAYVYLNNGIGGGFSGPTTYSIGTGPSSFQTLGVVLGHFKESTSAGHLDIALTNPTNNKVTILTNDGAGAFTVGNSYAVGTNPVYIATGDFEGTGHTSLAVANCTNCSMSNGAGSTVSVLYGNGDGTFQPAVSYTTGDGTQAIGVGDFNGDGAPDLAVANGNGNSLTILLNTGGTRITLGSSGTPSTFANPVTFTATISPTVITAAPGGSVTFMDGNTAIGSAVGVAAGQASITTSSLSAGTKTITAVYSGDGNYNPHTSGPITQVVNQAATSTSVASNLNPSVTGQLVTFTATVSYPGAIAPTGNVTFQDGGSTIGTGSLSGNTATFSTASLTIGTHSITAIYSGDSNFTGSASPAISQVVKRADTTSTLVSSVNPSLPTQSVTFTDTVTSNIGIPTGQVAFIDLTGGVPIGTPQTLVSGSASISTATLTAGHHSIRADYGGDAGHAPSQSNIVVQIVGTGVSQTTTSLTISVAPIRAAEPANTMELLQIPTVTATVTSAVPGTPSGQIFFQVDGGVPVTANMSGGSASFQPLLTVGSHTILATYSGDSTYAGSVSNPLPANHSPKPH